MTPGAVLVRAPVSELMSQWNRNFALRVALFFSLFSLTWILVSDRVLVRLVPQPEQWLTWQTLKGSLFVAISLLVILFLMLRARRHEQEMLDDLHENAQTLRLQSAALQAADHAIMLTDNRGVIQWTNPAFTRLTGYTAAEAHGKTPRDLVYSGVQDGDFYKKMWQTILAGQPWRGQLTNRRKDGSLYTEEQSITPVRDEQGRVTHFIAIKQDITGRNAQQQALRESEARYRSIFENTHTIMFIVDPSDGAIVDANPAAASFYGWSREELRQMNAADINTRAWEDLQDEVDEAHARQKNTFSFKHRLAGGEERHVEVSSGPITFEGRTLLYSIVRDVTERKRAQDEKEQAEAQREQLLRTVQQQAERLRGIMYSVPDGVLLVQPDGAVAVANPPAREHLSHLAGARVGDRLTHLGHISLHALLASPDDGPWHEIEYKDRVFEVAARSVEDRGWVFVLRDVTETRMVQRQLQRQERLAAVGQMAAGIAHDFNNILGVILLQAELMGLSSRLAAAEKERLAIIAGHAQRAADLTQQILDFSRHTPLERQPLDLLALLKEEVRMLRRTLPENIEADLAYEPGDYTVVADPARVQQVVMNLAVNARDAMPQGGRLRFRLAPLRVDNGAVAPLPRMAPGDWIRLTVADEGQGMDEDVLDHLFEPFFSTKAPGKGTGLGLSQVHGIIAQHDGHITVASEPGQGATFTIYLPAQSAPARAAALPADELPRGNGERLLIVEDEPSLRQAMAETLQLAHYDVLQAQNGEEALALVANGPPDVALVLSDIIMPGLGGVELYEALRQRQWLGPVIFLTGHAPQPDQQQLPPGCPVLLKPINPTRLTQTVRRALDAM